MKIGVLALQGDFAEHLAALRRLDGELEGNGKAGPHPPAPSQRAERPAGVGARLTAPLQLQRGWTQTEGEMPAATPDGRPGHSGEIAADVQASQGTIETVEVRLPEQLAAVDGLIIPGGESTTIGKLMVEYHLLEPLRQRIVQGMPTFGTCAGAIVLAKDIGGLDQPLVAAMDIAVCRNAFGRQLQSFETDLSIPALGHVPLRGIFIRAPAIVAVGRGVEVLARLEDGTIVAAQQGHLLATAFHPELTDDTRLFRHFVRLVLMRSTGGPSSQRAPDHLDVVLWESGKPAPDRPGRTAS